MRINVTVDTAKLDSLDAGLESRLSAVVRAHAFMVEGAAKVSILTGTKSGRTYTRTSTGKGGRVSTRTHRASAPGEAPANDLGILANSIRARSAGRLTWRVAAGARYAAALELGTRRIAPRPFLAPALESVRASFLAAVRAVFA